MRRGLRRRSSDGTDLLGGNSGQSDEHDEEKQLLHGGERSPLAEGLRGRLAGARQRIEA
jgi:hypothetical protein